MNQVGVPPEILRWVPRNSENGDCALVAIQLATGFTYEVVLAAAIQVQPLVLSRGLWWSETQSILKKLGYGSTIIRPKKYDLETSSGILCVKKKGEEHVVYLWAGRIIEPVDQTMFLEADDYLTANKYRAGGLCILYPDK